jgi:hypothetical protein
MLSFLRNRFGIPGVISVIALVFAMLGGAYAATSSGGSGSKASASATGKRGKRGPRGPKGATGPQGLVGPAGATGPQGPGGAKGDTGATGVQGIPGEDGETGFTETLPPEKTETGSWGVRRASAEGIFDPISFNIPLEEAPTSAVIVKASETSKPGCPGVTGGVPTAEPGTLCVYTAFEANASVEGFTTPTPTAPFEPGAGRTGTVLGLNFTGNGIIYGSWAVTAE